MKRGGLADYIARIAEQNGVTTVSTACSPDLEMCEIAHRMFSVGKDEVLLFTTTGTDYPVAMNLYASETRLFSTMGAGNCGEIQKRIDEVLGLVMHPHKGIKGQWHALRSLYRLAKLRPRHIGGKAS